MTNECTYVMAASGGYACTGHRKGEGRRCARQDEGKGRGEWWLAMGNGQWHWECSRTYLLEGESCWTAWGTSTHLQQRLQL